MSDCVTTGIAEVSGFCELPAVVAVLWLKDENIETQHCLTV